MGHPDPRTPQAPDASTPAPGAARPSPAPPSTPQTLATPQALEDEETQAYPPDSQPPLPGPVASLPLVEGHELLRELGRGGMGVVYLAREHSLGREVALKIVPPGLAPRHLKRFLEEATITGQLQHPAIVPIYRVGQTTNGLDYYTMKRVQGKTLSQILKEIRLNPQEAERVLGIKRRASIMLKVCEGIAFAHDRGVIHRDLKPGNIMLGEYGEVYVLDWGIAKALFGLSGPSSSAPPKSGRARHSDPASLEETPNGEAAAERTITGTPSYMSPEQARGEQRSVDQRSDVWSLGGILYALLALRPPISGATPAERLSKAAQGLVTPLGELPEGQNAPPPLQAIVEKALRADRAQRYASARELAADLRAYLDGKGSWQLAYEWVPGSAPEELERWQPCAGAWQVEPHGLYPAKRNAQGAVLLHPRRFFGDVRVELKGKILTEGDKYPGELAVLLSAPEPGIGVNETDGYCLQYGAMHFTQQKLAKNDIDVLCRPLEGAKPGETIALACERVGNRLRMELNGQELFCFQDLLPLGGCRVGLYGWFSSVRVQAVRIFNRGLDTQVSCLAVPDHDFERERFAEALAGYRRIAEELNGREEGFMARFKAGLSRMRAEDPLGAESEFQQLDGTPGEVLAQLGRAMLFQQEGDHCRELMRLGAAWRVSKGTPAESFVLAQLWSRATASCQQGNLPAAAQFLRETLRCEPPESPRRMAALEQLCQVLVHLDNPEEAQKVLTRINEEAEGPAKLLASGLRALMTLYCNRAEWDKARELGEQFRQVQAGVNPWPELLRIEWLRGDQEALRRQLECAKQELGPDQREWLTHYEGYLALDQGQLREAQQLFRSAMEQSQVPSLDVLLTHAWIYAMRGTPDRTTAALVHHLNAVDSAKRMEILAEIAELSRLRGNFSHALNCFQQILDNLPKTRALRLGPLCSLRLGLTWLGLGDRSQGYAQIQAALERDERTGNQAMVGVPAQSMLLWKQGDPLPDPPPPSQHYPHNGRSGYFLLLGEFGRLDGRPEEAIRAFNRAILDSPTPYRRPAWLAAVQLQEMGAPCPPQIPHWPPLKTATPA